MNDGYNIHMNINTAELKNNLSKYLKRIQRTGETIIVCDRDEPVATLSPVARDDDSEWRRYREEAQARALKSGVNLEIPERKPVPGDKMQVTPTIAPDGRADIETISFERNGKSY
ncbi:MAG: type II toxin-antitoxin system Phd/YefM family antitoxin [Myxococcota bacterium]|jgi:antitoxin (DNA-binding transcriptional repressor) of toxin-antitoxin stability system